MENEMQTELSNEKKRWTYDTNVQMTIWWSIFFSFNRYKEDATKVIVTVANQAYIVYALPLTTLYSKQFKWMITSMNLLS